MKRIIPFTFLFFSATAAIAQKNETIVPSGNIITKNVSVKPFDAIDAKGLYELVLTQGDNESVKIEADDNLQDLFSVTNEGTTLVIDMPKLRDKNINFDDKKDRHNLRLKVYVTFKKINSLDVGVIGSVRSTSPLKVDALEIKSKNVGNIEMQVTANKLTITNKGVGNLTLSGTAIDAVVTNSGVGKFDGEDLVVQTMDIDNSGVGSAEVHVEKSLKIKESFLGKVSNKGNAKEHKMDGVVI